MLLPTWKHYFINLIHLVLSFFSVFNKPLYFFNYWNALYFLQIHFFTVNIILFLFFHVVLWLYVFPLVSYYFHLFNVLVQLNIPRFNFWFFIDFFEVFTTNTFCFSSQTTWILGWRYWFYGFNVLYIARPNSLISLHFPFGWLFWIYLSL